MKEIMTRNGARREWQYKYFFFKKERIKNEIVVIERNHTLQLVSENEILCKGVSIE